MLAAETEQCNIARLLLAAGAHVAAATAGGLAAALLCSVCPTLAVIPGREAPVPVLDTYNPRPDADDILLPMPCDLKLALRKVTVPGGATYYIGKYEVSGYQWHAVMTGACEALSTGVGALPLREKPLSEVRVFLARYNAWLSRTYRDEAGLFAKGANGAGQARLPMQDEWEFAARGGLAVSDEERGQDIPQERLREYAVISEPAPIQNPERIGSRLPNPLGLYDVVGNVKEMVAAPAEGVIAFKGGSFRHTVAEVRLDEQDEITSLNERGEERRVSDLGFRVAFSGRGYESGLTRQALHPDRRTNIGLAPVLAGVLAALILGGSLAGVVVGRVLRRRYAERNEERLEEVKMALGRTLREAVRLDESRKDAEDRVKRLDARIHEAEEQVRATRAELEALRLSLGAANQARRLAEERAATAKNEAEQAEAAWRELRENAENEARRLAEEQIEAQIEERIKEAATEARQAAEHAAVAAEQARAAEEELQQMRALAEEWGTMRIRAEEEARLAAEQARLAAEQAKAAAEQARAARLELEHWLNEAKQGHISVAPFTRTRSGAGNASPDRAGGEGRPLTRTNGLGMTFALIPAGSFLMGSPEGVDEPDEHDQREVIVTQSFYLSTVPVTQAQWQAVMGNNPSRFKGPDNPVESVSWNDVQAFINKLNTEEGRGRYRLPSETEWEYACRADTMTRYCFGDDERQLGEYAWYGDNADGSTHPVGMKRPNAWGLFDMHGNVWEWCEDWYGQYGAGGPAVAPRGPASGETRVLRGGSFYYDAGGCRSAKRSHADPNKRDFDFGFRLVLMVE